MAPFVLRACSGTGIDQGADPRPAFSLFPNPATTSITVRYEGPAGIAGGTFCLFDAQGRLVRMTAVPNHAGPFEVDVRSLAPGAYTGRIITNTGALPAQRVLVVR